MDLDKIITQTLIAANTDVPEFLLAFDKGCLVVTACLERTHMLGESDLEKYEVDDVYDHFINFPFYGAESREMAWKHASAAYRAFLAKDRLYTAGLSIMLSSPDHDGILS